MIPNKCLVKHQPEHGYYGDCLRACVSSVLELPPERVPHFLQDGCDSVTCQKRIDTFLAERGLGMMHVYYPSDHSLQVVLDHVALALSPGVFYMLHCSISDGNHVVVCCGNEVVFDPAWYVVRDYRVSNIGVWVVAVIVFK